MREGEKELVHSNFSKYGKTKHFVLCFFVSQILACESAPICKPTSTCKLSPLTSHLFCKMSGDALRSFCFVCYSEIFKQLSYGCILDTIRKFLFLFCDVVAIAQGMLVIVEI